MKYIILFALVVAFIGNTLASEELVIGENIITVRAHLDDSLQNFNIYVSMPQNYFVGLGFGSSMKDANIVVIDATEESFNGVPVIHDAHSSEHGKPVDNEESVFKLLDSTSDGDLLTVALQRPVVVQRDGRDETIPFDEEIKMIYAFKEGKYGYHGKDSRGFFTLNVSSETGDVTFNSNPVGTKYNKIKEAMK
ncbi:unnamed protein product [Moneuplotes crassus]|uniref:DOMON domain-containing protein n=1 Tax=Euplotes crassus TaxID=5936 RepID=A0AAD1XJJ1_EUPCR|nr:unnamed protein product [Moneuplotes crassus]